MSTLDDISQILLSNAAGRGSGRYQQSIAQQGQDRNAISLYNSQQDATKLGLKAPGYLAGETARGDLLANLQPVSFSGLPDHIHVPTVTGGATPAALGPNARTAGADLSAQSLAKLQAGPSSYMPTAPSLTPMPTSGAWDTAAEVGGTGAALLNALLRGGSGSGGPGSSGGGDVGKLLSTLFGKKGGGGIDGSGNTEDTRTADTRTPNGNVDTGEFLGGWPEQGAPGSTPVDPSQLPGGVDPMQEYLDWLAQQNSGEGTGGNDGSTGTDWSDE